MTFTLKNTCAYCGAKFEFFADAKDIWELDELELGLLASHTECPDCKRTHFSLINDWDNGETVPTQKLYRFMSVKEFFTLANGGEIVNAADHAEFHTDSVGCCFWPEKVKYTTEAGETGEMDPAFTYNFLKGIGNFEYKFLVEFEALDYFVSSMKKSKGVYADPFTDQPGLVDCMFGLAHVETITCEELSVQRYGGLFAPIKMRRFAVILPLQFDPDVDGSGVPWQTV